MPVIDQVSNDYLDDVTFLAVAGRSDLARSRDRAPQWFSDNLAWGYDESIWGLYEVFGQPISVLITADDKVFDGWYGNAPEDFIRERLDALRELHP